MGKTICEIKNCNIKVVQATAKKTGKIYHMVVATINGIDVNIGLFDVYTENRFLRAGVKMEY